VFAGHRSTCFGLGRDSRQTFSRLHEGKSRPVRFHSLSMSFFGLLMLVGEQIAVISRRAGTRLVLQMLRETV
jgi:hypothetical protein